MARRFYRLGIESGTDEISVPVEARGFSIYRAARHHAGMGLMNIATIPCTLIVEDDPDTFEWVRRRIQRYGFEADWAQTLEEGLDKLAVGHCCVILDLSLPDGNGAEIIRHIRTNHLPVKVAVVSGTSDPAMLAEAALLRPDAFFTKPVDAIELVAWLQSVCF
jgi:DNA-binding response OmpR family regulator